MGILIIQKIIKRMITVDLEVQNIIPGNETVGKEIKDRHIRDLINSEAGSLSKNLTDRKTVSEGLGKDMRF